MRHRRRGGCRWMHNAAEDFDFSCCYTSPNAAMTQALNTVKSSRLQGSVSRFHSSIPSFEGPFHSQIQYWHPG